METARISALLAQLEETVAAFIEHFQQDRAFDGQIYAEWDEKDLLGHIVFWHESFARNVKDLSTEQKPTPLRGKLSEVNAQSVATTRSVPIPDLIKRLQVAQETVCQGIFHPAIELIPYKKGSRSYSPPEHLEVVHRHIQRHLKDLRKFATHTP